MSEPKTEEEVVLPHHEQQTLCTTRLAYRQGRKLTAVKVYTVNNESNHLLIFGVPSLKLSHELKTLFVKFGKLLRFGVSPKHPAEVFTETYHAVFESIQAARSAKKNLDTNNFYGGSLHICYAPELEDLDETRKKIMKRQQDVLRRLKNLQKEVDIPAKMVENKETTIKEVNVENKKLNMGEINVIGVGKQVKNAVLNKNKRKQRKDHNVVIEKQFVPNKLKKLSEETTSNGRNSNENGRNKIDNSEIDIIDCTSTEKETITNINDTLNYNKFGNEVIRKVPPKPLNTIKFNFFNKS